MAYDFTTRVNRKNTGSLKWEQMYQLNPNASEDVIPLSVADMEFKTPPEVVNGLKNFLDESILGYTTQYESFLDAVVNWQKRRHDWDIDKDWIVNTQGVDSALYTTHRAFSQEVEGIITSRPAYYPAAAALKDNKRTEVTVPLLKQDHHYPIHFDKFEEAAAEPNNKTPLLW